MSKIKKILFPFFKEERHKFLKQKWWFRLFIVVYISCLVISPFLIADAFFNSLTSWCYSSLPLYYNNTVEFNDQLRYCHEVVVGAQIPSLAMGIGLPLVIHYLTQLVFFKVIIDYIVLNTKKAV